MRFRMFRCLSALAERRAASVAVQGAVPERTSADILCVMAKKSHRAPAAVRTLWHVAGSGQK
jgi:hypothetical protein